MFLDGSLGSRTAWMLSPMRARRDRGMPITSEQEAREAMTTAAAAGIASTVHAIGDAAVRRALDLLIRLPAWRFRIASSTSSACTPRTSTGRWRVEWCCPCSLRTCSLTSS